LLPTETKKMEMLLPRTAASIVVSVGEKRTSIGLLIVAAELYHQFVFVYVR